jgi:hypothetical protein
VAAWYETKKPAQAVVASPAPIAAVAPPAADQEAAPDAVVPGVQP